MGLALYVVASRVITSRPLRAALAATVASQAALLFAYSLWGGVKELAAAWAVALLAALLIPLLGQRVSAYAMLPLAFASAALLAVLSFGGVVWLAPVLIPAAIVLASYAASGPRCGGEPRVRGRDGACCRSPPCCRRRRSSSRAKRTLREQRRGAREPGRAAQPPAARRHLARRRLPFRAGRSGPHLHPDRPAASRPPSSALWGHGAAAHGSCSSTCSRRSEEPLRSASSGRRGWAPRRSPPVHRRSCSRARWARLRSPRAEGASREPRWRC